jgi:hypothetical protein
MPKRLVKLRGTEKFRRVNNRAGGTGGGAAIPGQRNISGSSVRWAS